MQQQFNQINTELQCFINQEEEDKPLSCLSEISDLISRTILDVDMNDCTQSLLTQIQELSVKDPLNP